MQEVTNYVNEVVAEMSTSGEMKEMVKGFVKKAIESSFSDMFKSYGHVTKQLQAGLEEAIELDFSKFDIPSYNEFIMSIIRAGVIKEYEAAAKASMLDRIEKALSPAPAEITVAQLVEIFIEEKVDEDPQYDNRATLEIEEKEYGSYSLKLWLGPKDGTSSFSTRVSSNTPDLNLHIHKDPNCIGIIHSHKEDFGTANFGGDAKVFQMYAKGTVITDIGTVDTDDIDLALWREH